MHADAQSVPAVNAGCGVAGIQPGFDLEAEHRIARNGRTGLPLKDALAAQAAQAIAADAFTAFSAALTAEAGITLDEAAINAVNTSLP